GVAEARRPRQHAVSSGGQFRRARTMSSTSTLAVIALAFCTIVLAGGAIAQEFSPAIVFDMGGKFDKSFNEAAYTGAERFKKETGIAYREFEVTNEAQREQALRNMARRGSTIVVGTGFTRASGMGWVATALPHRTSATL